MNMYYNTSMEEEIRATLAVVEWLCSDEAAEIHQRMEKQHEES